MKNFFWILPFICFLAGYQIFNYFASPHDILTPSVVGMPLGQAIRLLSKFNLSPRIMAEKEDADLPEDTVLAQTPQPQRKIRQNQNIYVIVSKKPNKSSAPALLNKTREEAQRLIQKQAIRAKFYELPSIYPAGTCIAQLPTVGHLCDNNKMIVYVGAQDQRPRLFPDLRGNLLIEIQELLEQHDLSYTVLHSTPQAPQHRCTICRILEQKPLPGSLIHLNKPMHVQLLVG